MSSPDGPYRRHAEYHLAATASANPFLVRRDLPLLPSPSPTTAPGAWMTEARRATSVAWGERSASPSFCRSASFHRADTPRDEGGTRQADLYLMLHAGRLAAGPDAHALRGSRRTARSRRGRRVPPKSAAAQCAADLHVAATRACVYACVRACAVSGQHEARVERARNLKRIYLYLYIQARAAWLMQTARIDQTR